MDLQQKTSNMTNIFKNAGVKNVYFEPTQNVNMIYPCVVFKRGTISSRHADNRIYKKDDAYDATWISRTPDDPMVHTILENTFSKIRHIRHYVADGLHHDQFKIYY